jgi:hypothetical protein
MILRLNKQWFAPLYFIIDDLINDPEIRTILIYGGKSSSKTVSICQLLSKECYINKASTIAYRKESVIIPTTLKKSFNLAMDSMYINPVFERQDRIYKCSKGSEIVLKGLDDPEKAKGIESYKYVYLDELNQFEQSEYEQFQLGLRGIPGQKIFGSWNPVDENSWVKTNLIDKIEFEDTEYKLPSENSFVKQSKDKKTILIKTVYQDNYWICGSPDGTYGYRDENLISMYENLRTTNYNSYRVNVLGEWGKTTYGGEILKCWKSEIHTGNYPYNPELAVYLFFDENVNPYFPCGFFQIENDQKTFRMIHHIAARNPNNTVRWMCAEITRKLHQWGHTGRVYIGGDATSQKADVKQEQGFDLFKLIAAALIEFKPVIKVDYSNPSVLMSLEFLNSILSDNVEGLNYGVDKSCGLVIQDYENTKEDKNGKIDKATVRDPITKVTYQPYGHHVDILRYIVCTIFAKEYIHFQNRFKPLTPHGISTHSRLPKYTL